MLDACTAYDALALRLAESIMDQDGSAGWEVVGIVRRNFALGSPMARQREAVLAAVGTRSMPTRDSAMRFLGEARCRLNRIDKEELREALSRLCDDIRDSSFGTQKFLADVKRIPGRRENGLALAYLTGWVGAQDGTRGTELEIRLEEALAARMCRKLPESPKGDRSSRAPDVLELAMVLKGFRGRYGELLSERQRRTLSRVVELGLGDAERHPEGRGSSAKVFLSEERKRLKASLEAVRSSSSELTADPTMAARMDEALLKLRGEDFMSYAEDEKLRNVLLFQRLEEELLSDG